MKPITPFLWLEKEAGEAAKFYTSVFKESRIKSIEKLSDTPSGTVEIASIELFGQGFSLLAAGPLYKFTPAISFLVACKEHAEVDEYWGKLSQGGMEMMELGSYPFSERYAWVQDRYGLSWQIMAMRGDSPIKQKIIPTLMFVGKQAGKAEEAIQFYTSVFSNTGVDHILRYAAGEAPDQEGTIKHAGFTLNGQEFGAMDSAYEHNFTFSEAISFEIHCETQDEVDYFWGKLSADPEAEQCGWLKDKYTVSWQVVPTILATLLKDKDRQKVSRVTQAFLKMKKFDIAALKKAYEG